VITFTTDAAMLEPGGTSGMIAGDVKAGLLTPDTLTDWGHCWTTVAQGSTLEDVKDLRGHSPIVLTSNTYGHVLEERQRQVAIGMDAVLGG
jgi:integrase